MKWHSYRGHCAATALVFGDVAPQQTNLVKQHNYHADIAPHLLLPA